MARLFFLQGSVDLLKTIKGHLKLLECSVIFSVFVCLQREKRQVN